MHFDGKQALAGLNNFLCSVADGDGMTPLHYAAWYGSVPCCQVLLAAGANPNNFDHDGATSLHCAAFNGQLACVVTLVEAGADILCGVSHARAPLTQPSITDNESLTAVDQAAREKHTHIVEYLRCIGTSLRRSARVTPRRG